MRSTPSHRSSDLPTGVIDTAALTRRGASQQRPPAPEHLAIGHGPGALVDNRIDTARAMTAFGVSVALGTIGIRPDTIAFDLNSSTSHWWVLAACAVCAGTVIGALLDHQSKRTGRSGAPVIALGAAVAWVVLFNTGTPRWVEALLAIAIAGSIPPLLSFSDARRASPGRTSVGTATAVAIPTALGIATGAGVAFATPDLPWATIAAWGGLVAAIGAFWRSRLPGTVVGPHPAVTSEASPVADSTNATFVLLGLGLGPLLAAAVRLQPFLAEHWQVGVRYQFLIIALTGLVAAGTMIGVNAWHDDHRGRDVSLDASVISILAAGSMLLVAISQTLPGTVAGAALGAATAGVALALGSAFSTMTSVAALASGTAVLLGWNELVDGAGSNRVALALVAAPALVLGAMSMLGARSPRTTTVDLTQQAITSAAANSHTNEYVLPHPDLAPSRVPLLEVRGVEFSYGSVQALFGVDLDIYDGEITAVVGANGAGKTTLLRTISGLATPSAGSIRFANRDLAPFSAADRVLLGINQIAAGGAVAEALTVGENLTMFCHSLPTRDARAARHRVLEVFPQFSDRLHQRASSLSGGERQMLALSKALVLRPRLLIIDELSLGLAPIVVSGLVPVIRRLHADGSSVLLVEQSVAVALELADQASCMERGRIVYSSSAEALRSDPHLLEAAYLEGITAALEHRGLGV